MVGTEKESLPVMDKKEVEDEEGGLDGFDDEDFETLPCNLKYVVICLILPSLNGLLNGFLWPAYTLHFLNNGWPVVRAGLAQALGFSCRVLTQQMQLAAGYWLIVPLSVIHLAFAVLGFIYFDQEWAVFAEILVVFTIDPTCAIEGLAFDTFGNSESQARQASSTVLSVYTICVASACTIGGIAFDSYGWRGIAAFHTICQSALLFMLAIQPSMRQSFMEVCFPAKEPEKMEKDDAESSTRAPNTDAVSGAIVAKVTFPEKVQEDEVKNMTFMAVLPGAVEEEHNPPDAAGDLVVEEFGEGVDLDAHGQPGVRDSNISRVDGQPGVRDSNISRVNGQPGVRDSNISRVNGQPGVRDSNISRVNGQPGVRDSNISRVNANPDAHGPTGIRHSDMSRASGQTDGTHATAVTARTANTARTMQTAGTGRSAHTRRSVRTARSAHTGHSGLTGHSGHTGRSSETGATGFTGATAGTAWTARTVLTALSRVTALSEAGQDFHHHFGTNLATRPEIVGRTGAKRVLRDEGEDFDEEGDKVEESITETAETKARSKIPKDIRLPVFLIVLNCFTNTATYVIEFSTFALFFREVHSWNEATLASVAQTAGDVMAAVMMQVIPFLMPGGYDPDEAGPGPCSRFWHSLTSPPYTITCVLVSWMVFNACLISPWLPIAIVAQVFMGTSYVYSCKWSTDMSLFYSLGDSKVFLAIQVLCRNADALGGGLGSIFGTWLFTFGPTVPFIFGTGFTTTVFLLYTVCFCARLGFGDDIETAEAKRSRRLGKARVSSWAADAPDRKTQVNAADQTSQMPVVVFEEPEEIDE